jgi:hypothetical protein
MVRDIQSKSTNLGAAYRSFLFPCSFDLNNDSSEDSDTHTEQTVGKVAPFSTKMNNYFSQHVSTPLVSIDAQHQRIASLHTVLRRCHDLGVSQPAHRSRRWR